MRWMTIALCTVATAAVADQRGRLEDLDPPSERAAYDTWLASQSRAVRAQVKTYCADDYEWSSVCNGIGPYGLETPPRRKDVAERAAWEAALTPEQARYVARMCTGPAHLMSELCGYDLPAPPGDGVTLGAWRQTLSRNERAMVNEHCAEMTQGTDEYCDGIGPLHIPVPPLREGVMMRKGSTKADVAAVQAQWDAWYRGLTKAQKVYYRNQCTGPNAGISELCGGTPLLVALDGAPVEFAPAREESRFAIDGLSPLRTDWPTARTPWIARDLDGDGVIAEGSELFGSGTVLPGGRRAHDGFEALAALDDNHDGVIDAHDRVWGELLLWSDRDGDRRGAADELAPLSASIERISLTQGRGRGCDARGNCERLRASATLAGATGMGEVVDVQLLVQPPHDAR